MPNFAIGTPATTDRLRRHRGAAAIDFAYRVVYRAGFPLARVFWRLRGAPHHGTQVAIWVDGRVLCVSTSYRRVLTFPGGGVKPGEDPVAAAQRELMEELQLAVPADWLRLVFTARGRWDGRPDTVSFFELTLESAPAMQVDNREILAAMFLSPKGLSGVAASVRAYLHWRLSDGAAEDGVSSVAARAL